MTQPLCLALVPGCEICADPTQHCGGCGAQPLPDRTLVNTRPVHAGSTVYIAPSPLLTTSVYAGLQWRRRVRRTAR